MDHSHKGESPTVAALSGKHVLITGATGFLGKVVLEKLLRTVADIGGVYVLMRGNRRYPDPQARFDAEVAGSTVFDVLKKKIGVAAFNALLSERVHCVAGEVTNAQFGLSRQAFQELASRIDVVINSAASVNFREELDRALAINTLSLDNLIALSECAGNVPLIHVSTCYVNGFRKGDIHETSAPATGIDLPAGAGEFFETAALVERLLLEIEVLKANYQGRELKSKLVELGAKEAQQAGWNDTYTFTKWLGEQRLYKAMRGYPLTVLRPSIIESTLAEPCPGWIEGVKVADAVLMAYARGKIAFFPGRRSGVIDVIPADLVANAVLLSAGEQLRSPAKQRIYQCCSGARNPLLLGDFIDHLMAEAATNHRDYDKLFAAAPRRRFTAVDGRVFGVVARCVQVALGVVYQLLRSVGWRGKLKARRNLDTAVELSKLFSFYAQPSYQFHSQRLLSLSVATGDVDRALFPVDAALINWQDYIRCVHMPGLNHFALQGRTKSVPESGDNVTSGGTVSGPAV